MIYTPNRKELATIAQRLNLPTIPPTDFLSALIDAYADFCDVEYEDILNAIESFRKSSYNAGKAYYRNDTKEEYERLQSVFIEDHNAFINYMEKELEHV